MLVVRTWVRSRETRGIGLFTFQANRVWLLAHPQHRSKAEAFLAKSPNPNLKLVWITVKGLIDPWNPEHGEWGIRLHYLIWLSEAYKAAARLCNEMPFDIAHHLSWATISAPPPLWLLSIPVVWGPVGGGQHAPASFLRYFGRRTCGEFLRTIRVRSLRSYPRLRKALQISKLTFAVNSDTKHLLTRAGGLSVARFLDCGLPPEYVPSELPCPKPPGEFTLLWAGRLEPHKGLTLALRALAKVQDPSIGLVVAGTGPLRAKSERLVKRLQLGQRVKFLGQVPYEMMPALFRSCDAFFFTSVRDSFGGVVLEAMAHGLPPLTLDHQGVGDFVPPEAGIKVPVTTPARTIEALAQGIRQMATGDQQRHSMRIAAWNFAKAQTWDLRAARMSEIYEEVVSAEARRVLPVLQLGEVRPL